MKEKMILKVQGLNKSFGPTKAVKNMHLEICAGEIHGLIGENGSGKSTVTAMIAGCLKPDSGTIIMNGMPYAPKSMLEGRAAGICMLLQEKGTIDGLTISENIYLGQEDLFSKYGVVNRYKMDQAAKKVLESIGFKDIAPSRLINELTFEERKLIEVGIAIKDKPQILIVDETTTALSQKGREILYYIIRKLRDEGSAVIFISHDLEELKELCNRVTIMRDGSYITTIAGDEITEDTMRKNMIGRELTEGYYRTDYNENAECGKVVLDVENVTLNETLKNVSFKLHEGEILGIGGLTDCGMHELCKVIYGLVKPDSGTICLPQKKVTIKNSYQAASNGMGYIPKDREQEGLMMAASILDNITLMSLKRIQKKFLITPGAMKKLAKEQIDKLRIKIGGMGLPVSSLSGGNKQKVVIARCMANNVEIMIMDCPTRGIDIGVKASIYRLLEKFKSEGRAVLMVSEELPELLGMSDNLIIMKNGEVTSKFKRSPNITEHDIITKMI